MKKTTKWKRDNIYTDTTPSMVPYIKELELVKEKVRCNEHRGENTWCWVDPSNGNHVPLCLNDLQFWAKSLVRVSASRFHLSSLVYSTKTPPKQAAPCHQTDYSPM